MADISQPPTQGSSQTLPDRLRVVVIGGGVVGSSVLFHLAKAGVKDCALLERKELTAGSSWHAAGGFHAVNSDLNISALQAYTIDLYDEIQELSGVDAGIHMTGGINIAATEERWLYLRSEWARHRVLGIDSELIDAAEIRRRCPIVETHGIKGGLFDPKEGYLDPSGTTHAYAKSAQKLGGQIFLHTKVEALEQRSEGWLVKTNKGEIFAEHVVNAAGLWARQVGAMAGLRLPVVAMEHHYLITEALPSLTAMEEEIPFIIDLDGEVYLRQEHKGVLLGIYETPSTPWAVSGAPWDYREDELLPPDLDRLGDTLSDGLKRFPEIERAGIKRVVNGPFTFSPDGNPLVGPVRGLRNFWCACAVTVGFAQAGGIGRALAEWLTEGEPKGDLLGMDVARFGDYATLSYALATGGEFYERRFRIAYPNETWPAARPSKTTPLYGRFKDRGAVFGDSFALEVPLYFARKDEKAEETPTFRRSNAFPAVGEECRAVRERVGITEMASFSKYEVAGKDSKTFLDKLLACRLPRAGEVRLAPMLSKQGFLRGDLTVACLAEDRFWLFGSGYLQTFHMRWFEEVAEGHAVSLRNCSDSLMGFSLAGPRSRAVLEKLVHEDLSNEAFPFMAVRECDVGLAPVMLARLSVTGELGFELYTPFSYHEALYDALVGAGEGEELRDFGAYALNSLRIEKGFGIWSREFTPDFTAGESGLSRFVDFEKSGGFVGRDAALREREAGVSRRLVLLEIETEDADAWRYEPIWFGEKYVGFVTSGSYGHAVAKSLALGYVSGDVASRADGEGFGVHILGEKRSARIVGGAVWDARGDRMRKS